MVETAFRLIIMGIIVAFIIAFIGTVSFSWTINTSPYLSTLSTFLAVIFYILPIGKLSPILIIFISSMVFRIVIAVIRAIWSLFPIRT